MLEPPTAAQLGDGDRAVVWKGLAAFGHLKGRMETARIRRRTSQPCQRRWPFAGHTDSSDLPMSQ